MQFAFDNERPIYLQIAEQLKLEIISGRKEPNTRLPSVRELAALAQVNPNTIQKALGFLESEGLIYTKRTSGKFVTMDQERIASCQKELAMARTEAFIKEMNAFGLSFEQIEELLSLYGSQHGTSGM